MTDVDEVEVPPGGQEAPGWHRGEHGKLWLRCPNGHMNRLDAHTIYEDGVVEPSVECAGCTWQDRVKLIMYDGGKVVPT